jgi:hypothetical protein
MLLKREGKKERKGKEKGGTCDKNRGPPLLIFCFSQL